MIKIEIPESLRAYFDNKAVRRAVDELVDQLDGKDMPNCDWEEAQNYNQALLMAAQVRADYVALLFKVWDATFGDAAPHRLLGEDFDYEGHSPRMCWTDPWVYRGYYRDGDPDEDGRRDDLRLDITKDYLELRVYRYNEGGELDVAGTPKLERWSTQEDDESGPYLVNESVSPADFFAAPDAVIHRFAEDAANVVQALLET